MFTGIIETVGKLEQVLDSGTGRSFWIRSSLGALLKPDQSLAHEGVCLTVEEVKGDLHQVTAVEETLAKTNLGSWAPGRPVNLERAMTLGGQLDGHLVQGHVDTIGRCFKKEDRGGSWLFSFSYPEKFAALLIEKGSICLNGISLTIFDLGPSSFSVTIIPYTYQHTSIGSLAAGAEVNLEFDMVGKYILRKMQLDRPS